MLKYAFAGALALGFGHLVVLYRRKRKYDGLEPRIHKNRVGRVDGCEAFGEYVVRQIGVSGNTQVGKRLAKGAEGFLSGDKSGTDDSLQNLFNMISKVCGASEKEKVDSLYQDLLKELDLCMLSYFSFHWNHSAVVLDQILEGEKGSKGKLRKAVLNATRKIQYEELVKSLKMKRVISTLLEQLKRMGRHPSVPDDLEVMVPAESAARSPVLLLIGGGMGAGKSTAVKDVMQCSFWSHVGADAVTVEADSFKETDIIYRALSSLGHTDLAATAQLVHHSSTQAASSLLVAALNEGRDVIFDGTMSWEPFVLQTIAMARDVHNRRYQLGPGYVENPDGTVQEKYWEPSPEGEEEENAQGDLITQNTPAVGNDFEESKEPERKPYRIELVGVTCEAHLAVVRGMRRAILTGRGVPIGGQLKSHKMFTKSLEKYVDHVDHAKVFSTSAGTSAELIGWKEGKSKLLVDNESFAAVKQLATLNQRATSIYDLYPGFTDKCGQLQKWKDVMVSQERTERQAALRKQLLEYEASTPPDGE